MEIKMWFKRKKEEPVHDWKPDAIKELRAFRDLGETFNYLGREVVVTGHFTHFMAMYHCSLIPQLRGDYADECGIIHNITFEFKELGGIKKQNPA
jgi:hypothetical protein